MSKVLLVKLWGASTRSITVAVLNLLITVIVVRWFGAENYANYMVDLAIIGIISIVLEFVPSNYSLFKIQDDSSWLGVIVVQTIISIVFGSLITLGIFYYTDFFKDFTLWMLFYVMSLGVKRYLDIHLQSSGRLNEYLEIEVIAALVRLLLMLMCLYFMIEGNIAIWLSLTVGIITAQAIWFIKNDNELKHFAMVFKARHWIKLFSNFDKYQPYYVGIILKRIRDNAVPLVAQYFFSTASALATFFLAYRGVTFAVSQIRIIESLLNHRQTLNQIMSLKTKQKFLITFIAQILCLISAFALQFLANVGEFNYIVNLILSFIIWPIVFNILERTKAYSNYQVKRVNYSMVGYLLVIFNCSFLLNILGYTSIFVFVLILVLSEYISFEIMRERGLFGVSI